jgi:hypothetical protein
MINRVFLSYSQQDEGKIPAIIKKLSQHELYNGNELSVMTHELKGYKDFDIRQEIKRSISQADVVVIVWTLAGAHSNWVNYEVGMADALNKRIVIVRPDKNSPAVPANLNTESVQVVDLIGSSVSA